jgi:hypothetical protein
VGCVNTTAYSKLFKMQGSVRTFCNWGFIFENHLIKVIVDVKETIKITEGFL